MAARLSFEPGPVRCWVESGSLSQSNVKSGTASFHNSFSKTSVVQSLRDGFVAPSSGKGPNWLVRDAARDDGREAPAYTLIPCSVEDRSARSWSRATGFAPATIA